MVGCTDDVIVQVCTSRGVYRTGLCSMYTSHRHMRIGAEGSAADRPLVCTRTPGKSRRASAGRSSILSTMSYCTVLSASRSLHGARLSRRFQDADQTGTDKVVTFSPGGLGTAGGPVRVTLLVQVQVVEGTKHKLYCTTDERFPSREFGGAVGGRRFLARLRARAWRTDPGPAASRSPSRSCHPVSADDLPGPFTSSSCEMPCARDDADPRTPTRGGSLDVIRPD